MPAVDDLAALVARLEAAVTKLEAGAGSVRPPGVSTHEDLEDDRLLVDEDSILSHVVNNIMHRIVMDSC